MDIFEHLEIINQTVEKLQYEDKKRKLFNDVTGHEEERKKIIITEG